MGVFEEDIFVHYLIILPVSGKDVVTAAGDFDDSISFNFSRFSANCSPANLSNIH